MVALVTWPNGVPSCFMPDSPSGGPKPNRYSFQADSEAVPIERPRYSLATEVFDVELTPMTRAQFAAFQAWFAGPLAYGVNIFVQRHPITGTWGGWRIVATDPAYHVQRQRMPTAGSRGVRVSFKIQSMPGTAWIAPYMAPGVDELPAVILDYANGLFAIDGKRMPRANVFSTDGVSTSSIAGGKFPDGLFAKEGTLVARGVFDGPGALERTLAVEEIGNPSGHISITQTTNPAFAIQAPGVAGFGFGPVSPGTSFSLALAADGNFVRAAKGGVHVGIRATDPWSAMDRIRVSYASVTLSQVLVFRSALSDAALQAVTS